MSKKKVIVPNVVRGGIAIPLKNMTNYYYMLGRSHENGGIDIGKDVEVQGGELVQTTKDAIKVFSDEPFSDPPFNGKSSSRRVLGGENPNKVFNQQEEFKKRHGLNDDGSMKKQRGGRVYLSSTDDYYDDGRNNLGVYTTRTDAIRGPQIVQREDLIGDIAKMNRAIQKHEQNLYNSSRPRTDLNFRVSSPTGDVVTNDPSNLWWSNKLHFKRNIPLGILYTDEKGNDVPFYTEAVVTGRRPRKIHEYSSSDIASGVTGGVLNWSSPSQVFGTVSDIYNKKPNWSEGMILGNSGFVSDEFMQEHPVYGSLANLAGDIAVTGPKALSSVPKGVTSLAKNTKKVITAGRNIGRRAMSKIDDIVEQGNNKITAAKNRFDDVIDNLGNQLYPSRQAYIQGVDGNYYSVDDVFGDNYMSFSKRKNKSKRKNTVSSRNNTLNNGTNTADDEIRIPEPDPDEVDNATIFEQANESNAKSDTNTSNMTDNVDDVDDFDDTQTHNNKTKTKNQNKPLFRRLLRNIWEKEKNPLIGMPTGAGILGGGIATYHWLNDRKSPDEDIPLNIDETYTPIGNDTTTIPYITPYFDNEIQEYDIKDSIPSKRMGGLNRYKDINAKVYSKYPELRKKAKAGGLYSVTVDGKTSLRRFPSTGKRTKAALGIVDDIDYSNIRQDIFNNNTNNKHEGEPEIFLSPLRSNILKENPLPSILPNIYTNIDKTNIPMKDHYIPTYTPTSRRDNFRNKIKKYVKEYPGEVNDLIGLTSNITGGLLSHRINRKMLNRLQYIAPPTPRSAVKLKTHININPQLDRMRESLANYERTINDNTTSSNVALARRNQARLANTMQANELYGNRENAETQLINQDRTNQQNVANENIADYNKWLEGLNAFRNSIIDKKSENNISLVENINSGIQDLINRREKRRSDNQTIAAMTLANPDLPVEMLYAQGLINKSLYDRYIKAYRNRNNKTTTQQG